MTNRENEQPSGVTGASESHPAVNSAQPPEDILPVVSDTLPVVSDTLPVVSDTLPVANDLSSVVGETPRLPSTALTVPLVQPIFIQPTVTAHVTPSTHTVSPSYTVQSYIDSHITRLPDGIYTAKFPWKPNHPPLSTNFALCERRTRSLLNKLAHTPELLVTYNNILSEQAA